MVVRGAVVAMAAALAVAACDGNGEPQAGPSPSPTFDRITTASPGALEWLAVFETAEDPNALADLQADILEAAPNNVVLGPAGCWDEVPGELGVEADHYVAGVVAASPEELADAVDAVGAEPIFEGQVTLIACG